MSVESSNQGVFDAVKMRHRILVILGTSSVGAGALLALWVAYDWFLNSVSHEILAIVAASAILFGVQLLVFATLTDMLILLHREQIVRLESADEEN